MAWFTAHIEVIKSVALGISEILGLLGLGGISSLALKAAGFLKSAGAKEPGA